MVEQRTCMQSKVTSVRQGERSTWPQAERAAPFARSNLRFCDAQHDAPQHMPLLDHAMRLRRLIEPELFRDGNGQRHCPDGALETVEFLQPHLGVVRDERDAASFARYRLDSVRMRDP